jgi:hypothetical protein
MWIFRVYLQWPQTVPDVIYYFWKLVKYFFFRDPSPMGHYHAILGIARDLLASPPL